MIKSKLSLSIAREFKDIIIKNMKDIIPRDNFYMLHVPEKLDVMNSVPIVKVTTVTSTPRGHASNMTSFTAERSHITSVSSRCACYCCNFNYRNTIHYIKFLWNMKHIEIISRDNVLHVFYYNIFKFSSY